MIKRKLLAAIMCAAISRNAHAGRAISVRAVDMIALNPGVSIVEDSESPSGRSIAISPELRGELVKWALPHASFEPETSYTFYLWLKVLKLTPEWGHERGPSLFHAAAIDSEGREKTFRDRKGNITFRTRGIDHRQFIHGRYRAFPIGTFSPGQAGGIAEILLARRDHDAARVSEGLFLGGFTAIPEDYSKKLEATMKGLADKHAALLIAVAGIEERLTLARRYEELRDGRISAAMARVAAGIERIRPQIDEVRERYVRLHDNPLLLADTKPLNTAGVERQLRRAAALLGNIENRQRALVKRKHPWVGNLAGEHLLLRDAGEPPLDYAWRIGLDVFDVNLPPPAAVRRFGVENFLLPYRYSVEAPGRISPEEGRWDFTWFDERIAENTAAGYGSVVNCMGAHNAFYPPAWLLERYGEDIYQRDWKGNRGDAYTQTGINIWHDGLRKFIRDYLRALGEHLRDEPGVAYYVIASEVSQDLVVNGKRRSPGYSRAAVAAFREYLEKEFVTIERLNRAWGSGYGKFGDITPPPCTSYEERRSASPLAYHFERFRRDSFAGFLEDCYRVLKEADPGRPVLHGFTYNYFDAGLLYGCDTFQSWGRTGDVISRMALGGGGHPADLAQEFNYGYSLGRFYPSRPGWVDEFHDETPEAWWFNRNRESEFTAGNQEILKAVMRRNTWQSFAWGSRRLLTFVLSYPCPSWGGGWFDHRYRDPLTGEAIMRPCAVSMPLTRQYMEKFEAVTRKTVVSPPDVGMLIPMTAMLTSYPVYMQATEDWVARARLFDAKYSYLYIPEEVVLDGRDKLENYAAVHLPYATHFPGGLTEKLLEYVRGGGMLICSGPAGVFDRYGNEDMEFIRAVFGPNVRLSDDFTLAAKLGLLDEMSVSRLFEAQEQREPPRFFGEYWTTLEQARWVWMADGIDENDSVKVTHWLTAKDGGRHPGIVTGRFGRGKVMMSFFGMSMMAGTGEVIDDFLARRVKIRQVDCDHPSQLDIVLREVPGEDTRYLFLTNISSEKDYRGEIRVRGRAEEICDITGPVTCPVEAGYAADVTRFTQKLSPGHFAVIRFTMR